MKTFTIAGTSVNPAGQLKLRVANGSIAHRVSVLKRCDHTDINLQELPSPMTRAEALEFLGLNGKGLRITTDETETVVVGEMKVSAETDVPAEVMIEG